MTWLMVIVASLLPGSEALGPMGRHRSMSDTAAFWPPGSVERESPRLDLQALATVACLPSGPVVQRTVAVHLWSPGTAGPRGSSCSGKWVAETRDTED